MKQETRMERHMKLYEAYDRWVPEVFQHVKDVVEPEVLDPALTVIRRNRQPQVLGSALENIQVVHHRAPNAARPCLILQLFPQYREI